MAKKKKRRPMIVLNVNTHGGGRPRKEHDAVYEVLHVKIGLGQLLIATCIVCQRGESLLVDLGKAP